MRTFLLAAVMLVAPASTEAATRNFGITGFTKIRVEGPYRVSLTTGVPPFARATGSAAALDRVAVEMRGDTLIVHSNNSSWGGYPGADAGAVEINVGTHDLSAAWLNGSGSLAIDRVKGLSFALSVQGSGASEIGSAAIDQLSVSVVGSASAKLGGQALKLTAIVRGISTLDAAGLAVQDATVGADGSATVDANVSGTAKLDATGPATIRLTGRPSCTLKVSGSTSVSGCKSGQ
jgi:putative autotransporter adhesin-like protein